MPTKKIYAKWLRFTEEDNALDYLEKASFYISQTEKDKKSWKWVILCLHGALYGFSICAIKGTNPDRVIDFKSKYKTKYKIEELPQNIIEHGFPSEIKIKYNSSKKELEFISSMSFNDREQLLQLSNHQDFQKAINYLYNHSRKLISFYNALKRCQNPDWMRQFVRSRTLKLDRGQKWSINKLKKEFRNCFEHYQPLAWSIEIHGMPQIAIQVLDVIRFLAIDSGNIFPSSQNKQRKIKSLIFQSKKVLKRTKLYKESLIANQEK